MRKRKVYYSFSAFLLACIISFSGIGGSYIQARASSGITDVLWNTDATALENIGRHLLLWANVAGVAFAPNLLTAGTLAINASDFYNFMLSDGYTEEQANEIVYGGGGHVREGIKRDDETGDVTYSDEVSDLFYDYLKHCIDTNNGYILVPTKKPTDIRNDLFSNSGAYNNSIASLEFLCNRNGLIMVNWIYNRAYNAWYTCNIYNINENQVSLFCDSPDNLIIDFYNYKENPSFYLVKNDSWNYSSALTLVKLNNQFDFYLETATRDENDIKLTDRIINENNVSFTYFDAVHKDISSKSTYMGHCRKDGDYYYDLFTLDGRYVKVWYDMDAFKDYSCSECDIYVSDGFYKYEPTKDNTTTITNKEYNYYVNNSTTNYETIQNTINNYTTNNYGSELTEEDVQRIVNDAVASIRKDIENLENNNGGSEDETGGEAGSEDETGGENDSQDGSSGTGVGAIIEGIGKLLDTILTLIGKLMGIVADFTESVLNLFTGFTTFTDGFTGFLSETFTFIPAEIWNLIGLGLSLAILCAVINFLRK